jgi:RimJ/RimL family protein N-acetyltransferase
MQLIFGHDEALAGWAASRIRHMASGFGLSRAIGVATGLSAEDKLLAVIVYHDFIVGKDDYKTCQISIAASSPHWARRGVIYALLSVPFEQYGVNKLWSVMASDNPRVLRFNQGIGFKREGVLRQHFGSNVHAVVSGMMAKEFKNLYQDPIKKRIEQRKEQKKKKVVIFPTCDFNAIRA